MEQHPQRLRLDCSGLDPVHSSHIGLLWQAREICRQASVEVLLENANHNLVRTLQALDLTEVFGVNIAHKPVSILETPIPEHGPAVGHHAGEFSADVDSVDRAVNDFLEFLGGWNLSEEIKFDLRTIFYEAATNIRLHAGLIPDDVARYSVTFEAGELRLVFEDEGIPFDPLTQPESVDPRAAAQNHQTRGFGISLMRRLVDDMQYTRRDDTTNVLSLVKQCGDWQ